MAFSESAYGTKDSLLVDPPVPGNYDPSAWGTVDSTLTNPGTTTVPSVPQNLRYSKSGTLVTLTWDAPSSNGGASITHWGILLGRGVSGDALEIAVGSSPYSYTFDIAGVSDLNQSDSYAAVRAKNSEGFSDLTPRAYFNTALPSFAPSAWGTRDSLLIDPAPPGGYGPSDWGTCNSALSDPGTLPAYAALRYKAETGIYIGLDCYVWSGSQYRKIN